MAKLGKFRLMSIKMFVEREHYPSLVEPAAFCGSVRKRLATEFIIDATIISNQYPLLCVFYGVTVEPQPTDTG